MQFQLYTFLGSWPWCLGLAYIGFVLGEHWKSDPNLRAAFHNANAIALAALVTAFQWFLWTRWRDLRIRIRRGEDDRDADGRL
jgi:membrane protein DedA with SNARE-associated domain